MVDIPKHEMDSETHLSEVKEWHSNRLMELRKPDGWLSVIGLHWLEPGENTFGSDPSNKVVFPDLPGIPGRIGSFIVEKNRVEMVVEPEVEVTIEGEPVRSSVIYGKSKRPITASLGSLHWQVIKRQDLIGVRLRDSANPAIATFKGVECFPVSLDWRIPARARGVKAEDRWETPMGLKVFGPQHFGWDIEHVPLERAYKTFEK